MATETEIVGEISRDEIDYQSLAARLTRDDLPKLRAIIALDHPNLAPRAAYLAAMIDDSDVGDIIDLASRSPHDVVRVAAAAALSLLQPMRALPVAERLAEDSDPGVRFRTLKAVTKLGSRALSEKVRDVVARVPDARLQELAHAAVLASR